MNMVVLEKGEARVKRAVEERMCMVAERMKWVLPSEGASGSEGSSLGSFGVERWGADRVMGNWERTEPRAG